MEHNEIRLWRARLYSLYACDQIFMNARIWWLACTHTHAYTIIEREKMPRAEDRENQRSSHRSNNSRLRRAARKSAEQQRVPHACPPACLRVLAGARQRRQKKKTSFPAQDKQWRCLNKWTKRPRQRGETSETSSKNSTQTLIKKIHSLYDFLLCNTRLISPCVNMFISVIWKFRWDRSPKRLWTYRLIWNTRLWIKRRHEEVDYYLTQLLSGHGFFKHHSQRYDHNASANCLACPHTIKNVEYVFFHCHRFEEKRRKLHHQLQEVIRTENVVQLMLEDEKTGTRSPPLPTLRAEEPTTFTTRTRRVVESLEVREMCVISDHPGENTSLERSGADHSEAENRRRSAKLGVICKHAKGIFVPAQYATFIYEMPIPSCRVYYGLFSVASSAKTPINASWKVSFFDTYTSNTMDATYEHETRRQYLFSLRRSIRLIARDTLLRGSPARVIICIYISQGRRHPITLLSGTFMRNISYTISSCAPYCKKTPPGGLEPPTFRLTAERASQLRHGGSCIMDLSQCTNTSNGARLYRAGSREEPRYIITNCISNLSLASQNRELEGTSETYTSATELGTVQGSGGPLFSCIAGRSERCIEVTLATRLPFVSLVKDFHRASGDELLCYALIIQVRTPFGISTPPRVRLEAYDNNNTELRLFFNINDSRRQSVQVNARNNLDRTPLQLAVANLLPYVVDDLLNHGADLSSFVFPSESYFAENFDPEINHSINFKLRLASGALATVEILEKRGYELDHSNALTIMKFFAKYDLFEKSDYLYKFWRIDEYFLSEAKKLMIQKGFSLYDLVQLRPEEAAKKLTYSDYLEFAYTAQYSYLSKGSHQRCTEHFSRVRRNMTRVGHFRRRVVDQWNLLVVLSFSFSLQLAPRKLVAKLAR
ncbi:unnamed protein product, partial [Trichogramma brassicae]